MNLIVNCYQKKKLRSLNQDIYIYIFRTIAHHHYYDSNRGHLTEGRVKDGQEVS